jgi:8-oxo-dGTP pyrophosphatase MutT (NUDIX family)
MSVPNKGCPVVFRDPSFSRILVFKHPFAGIQLVKGTIETGETPAAAALRELCEESGICDGRVDRDLGIWESGFQNQIWSLHLCSTARELPKSWLHHTNDDGGLDLTFYWYPINQIPDHHWHSLFRRALLEIAQRVGNTASF